jgi:hypothetical protein
MKSSRDWPREDGGRDHDGVMVETKMAWRLRGGVQHGLRRGVRDGEVAIDVSSSTMESSTRRAHGEGERPRVKMLTSPEEVHATRVSMRTADGDADDDGGDKRAQENQDDEEGEEESRWPPSCQRFLDGLADVRRLVEDSWLTLTPGGTPRTWHGRLHRVDHLHGVGPGLLVHPQVRPPARRLTLTMETWVSADLHAPHVAEADAGPVRRTTMSSMARPRRTVVCEDVVVEAAELDVSEGEGSSRR